MMTVHHRNRLIYIFLSTLFLILILVNPISVNA